MGQNGGEGRDEGEGGDGDALKKLFVTWLLVTLSSHTFLIENSSLLGSRNL